MAELFSVTVGDRHYDVPKIISERDEFERRLAEAERDRDAWRQRAEAAERGIPAGSFVPTGEVRLPLSGEFFWDNDDKCMAIADADYRITKYPIYRRIDGPAESESKVVDEQLACLGELNSTLNGEIIKLTAERDHLKRQVEAVLAECEKTEHGFQQACEFDRGARFSAKAIRAAI